MDKNKEQEILLKIVETWRPSQTPEYRGFKCANCQQFKNQAWYHWVNSGNYRLPIHMCDDKCEPEFQAETIKIDESKIARVDREKFGSEYHYSDIAKDKFREIVASWPEYDEPKLKAFICDSCNEDLTMETLPDGSQQRQGFHVWWKMDDGETLAELHFHKDCASKLNIS
ncbi:MAG TPA: hypothetical protein VG917_03430 [Patescibacteria group bacterium]|nr:hypothetical protein [Patescibacteria group bacterium]